MSDKVDKRIVELDFDNDKFKKGISDTLESMKKINSAFDLKDSTKNVKDLDQAIKGIDASNLTAGIEHVKAEFSVMGAVGFSAIQKITGAIMDLGGQVIRSFTLQPITDGFTEYNLKMNSIKTIQTNTMGAFSDSDEQLKAINKTLSDLNDYADKTIYNFAEMTRNIGTFTAAGIGLEESSQAIQGISNLAAASGSNAQQASTAMYQLSQALSSGTMKLMDWRSVINAGMGGQMFQNELIRTSEAFGTGAMDAIEKQGSFNESLQEGWATAEVLTKTLRNMTLATNEMTEGEISAAREMLSLEGYSEADIEDIFKMANAAQEAATKVRTFEQLIDTTKESLGSGWAQSWEYIVGDISQAENLFTDVSNALNDAINGMSERRNAMLKTWSEDGGRTAIIGGLKTFADVIKRVVEPIKQAFGEVFAPITGADLLEFSDKFREFFVGLRTALMSDTGKNFLSFLHDFSKGIFEFVKTIMDIGSFSFDKIIGFFKTISTFGMNSLFGSENSLIPSIQKTISEIQKFIDSLNNLDTSGAVNFANNIKEVFNTLFFKDASFNFEEAKKNIYQIESMIVSAVGMFLGIKFVMKKMESAKNATDALEGYLDDIVDNITGGFKALKKGVTKVSRAMAVKDYLVGFTSALLGLAGSLYLIKDIDIETMLPKLGILLGALVVLIGLAKVLSLTSFSLGKSITSAIALVVLCESLTKIAKAINLLSMISENDPIKTILQTAALVIALIGAAGSLILLGRLGDKIIRSALAVRYIIDAFMGIALSIAIMSLSTNGDSLGALNYMMVILTGLVGVSVMLGVLSNMEKPIVKAGAAISGVVSAMMGVSLAIAVLSLANSGDAVASLSQLGVILAGLLGVGLILIGLGKFGEKLIRSAFAVDLIISAMMGVSLAIAVLSLVNSGDAVASLSQLGVILAGLLGVGLILIGLGKFGEKIVSSAFAVDLIISAMMGVSLAIAVLSLVNSGDALTSLGQVGVILAGLLGVGLILIGLGKFGEKIVSSAFAVDLIIAAMLGISLSLALLYKAFNTDILSMIGTMATVVLGIGALALVLVGLSMVGPKLLIGALALGVMSTAILLISTALTILSSIPFTAILGSVVGITLALLAFAGISVLLEPIIPAMFAVGAAVLMFSLGLNLAAVAMMTFMAILTAMANMSADSGEKIIAAAATIGEALAAFITSLIGRIIIDIGNGISNLANTVKGKEGEIFDAARSLGKAIISGILGGLVGIGEAILGAITKPIVDAVHNTSQIVAENGGAVTEEMLTAQIQNPEIYGSVGGTVDKNITESVENADAGKEGGEEVAENVSEGAGEVIDQEIQENVHVDEALQKATENADTSGLNDMISQMFGDAFTSEEVFANMGDFGGSMSSMIGSGLLDGAASSPIDPGQLFSNMGLGSGMFDQKSSETGKEIGKGINDGTFESLKDTSQIDSGINSQLDTVKTHKEDYYNAGNDNAQSYVSGVRDHLYSNDLNEAVSANTNSLSSGIEVASEIGKQTGQSYGSKEIEVISSFGTLISVAVKNILYASSEQSNAISAGELVGIRYGNGIVNSIENKSSKITSLVANVLQKAASDSDPGGKGYQAGVWFANGASTGVEMNIGDMSGTVGTAFSNAASDSDPGGKGYQAGEWFARGMASGIAVYTAQVAEEAANMVKAAKEAADEEADSASPSKEMKKRGRWFDEGMALGIKEYSNRVSSAAGDMTGEAVDNASSAFSLMGGLIDQVDWNTDPKITPILDLDKFREDAASMTSFMPDSQVVSASYAGTIDNVKGYAAEMSVQNQSNAQNGNSFYITLDWKAGTSANQMVKQLADELQTFNLTKGR